MITEAKCFYRTYSRNSAERSGFQESRFYYPFSENISKVLQNFLFSDTKKNETFIKKVF